MKRLASVLLVSLIASLMFSLACPVHASPDTDTLNPNGAGDTQQWDLSDSTHHGALSDASDSTYIYTGTDEEIDVCAMSNPTFGDSDTINSVTYYMRAASDGSGQGEYLYFYHSDGANEGASGSRISITTSSMAEYSQEAETPPDAGAWTKTDLTNLQMGVQVETIGTGETLSVAKTWVVVDYTAEANEENFHGTVNAQTTVASSKTASSTHYGTVNPQASVASQSTMLFDVNVPVAGQLSPSSSKAFAATFNVAVASQSMVNHQSSWQFILSSMFSPQWTVTGTTATTQLLNFFGAVSSAATTETQNTWSLTRFGVAAPNFVISSDKAWAFAVHQLINVAAATQTGNTWSLSRFGVANPGFVLSIDRAWAFGMQQIIDAVLGSTGAYSNVAGNGGNGASSGTTGGPPRTFPVTDSGVGLELASAEDEFTFMPFIDTTYEVQVYLYSNLLETQIVDVRYSLNRLNETVWSDTGTFQVSSKSYLPVTFEFPVESEGEYTVVLQVVSHEPSQMVTKTFQAKSGLFQLIPYLVILLFIVIVISKRKKRKR